MHRRGQDTSPGWREADEFDDRFVAPRNGFRNAMDYSRRTAGALRLSRITVPTLMLHARNDPWIPVGPYVGLQAAAPTNVMIKVTQSRGHVGFHEHGYADTWHDRMIDACLTERNAGVATASGL